MKILNAVAIALLCSTNLFAQINISDSTVQVIGYWSKNEKQTYLVSLEKYKINKKDTTDREVMKYEVDITIKDSTANSYTIEWFYKNFTTDSKNEWVKKIAGVATDIPVIIKTNEYGAFSEVVNWKEVGEYIKKATNQLKKDKSFTPEMEKVLSNVLGLYTTKESIEANAIKDVLQFYTYHGGKYTLGEQLTGKEQLRNNFGGNPFDVDITVSLDEVDTAEDNSVLRSYQKVNPEQLTDATYKFLQSNMKGGSKFPSRNEFPLLHNETWASSRIHGSSDWVIYSVETKETSTEEITNVEERVIEIK